MFKSRALLFMYSAYYYVLFTYRNNDNPGITCRIHRMQKIDVALLAAPVHRNLSVIITLCNKARKRKARAVTGEDPVNAKTSDTHTEILRTYAHNDVRE